MPKLSPPLVLKILHHSTVFMLWTFTVCLCFPDHASINARQAGPRAYCHVTFTT